MRHAAEAPVTRRGAHGERPPVGTLGICPQLPPVLVGVSPGGVGHPQSQPAHHVPLSATDVLRRVVPGSRWCPGWARVHPPRPSSPCQLQATGRAATCRALWGPRSHPQPHTQAGSELARLGSVNHSEAEFDAAGLPGKGSAAGDGRCSAGRDSCAAEIYSLVLGVNNQSPTNLPGLLSQVYRQE